MKANTMHEGDKLLFDRKSAAYCLSISLRALDYALARGEFETRKNGRKTLITAASLRRYAAKNHFGAIAGSQRGPKNSGGVVARTGNSISRKARTMNAINEKARTLIEDAGIAGVPIEARRVVARAETQAQGDNAAGLGRLTRDTEVASWK